MSKGRTEGPWSFSIALSGARIGEPDDGPSLPVVPRHIVELFQKDGFVVFPSVLPGSLINSLNDRLEEILRGRYDRGSKPDKTPKILKTRYRGRQVEESKCGERGGTRGKPKGTVGALGFSGNYENVRVLQVINVHKADYLFRQLAVSPALGKLVADLAGWKQGTRLAQDQIWAKPPHAPPLTFHRDSPYFMFDPDDVVTVWVALDDMDAEIGPLQYVKGSHLWGDGRIGSASQFFDINGHSLLQSAADLEGIKDYEIVSMAGLLAGGLSVHNGRTWHGSARNSSTVRPRRGLGLHFVPAEVKFTSAAKKSSLWRRYVNDHPHSGQLPDDDFPVTWHP
jgi:hypothetical protein